LRVVSFSAALERQLDAAVDRIGVFEAAGFPQLGIDAMEVKPRMALSSSEKAAGAAFRLEQEIDAARLKQWHR
jgi:hypothetical protein